MTRIRYYDHLNVDRTYQFLHTPASGEVHALAEEFAAQLLPTGGVRGEAKPDLTLVLPADWKTRSQPEEFFENPKHFKPLRRMQAAPSQHQLFMPVSALKEAIADPAISGVNMAHERFHLRRSHVEPLSLLGNAGEGTLAARNFGSIEPSLHTLLKLWDKGNAGYIAQAMREMEVAPGTIEAQLAYYTSHLNPAPKADGAFGPMAMLAEVTEHGSISPADLARKRYEDPDFEARYMNAIDVWYKDMDLSIAVMNISSSLTTLAEHAADLEYEGRTRKQTPSPTTPETEALLTHLMPALTEHQDLKQMALIACRSDEHLADLEGLIYALDHGIAPNRVFNDMLDAEAQSENRRIDTASEITKLVPEMLENYLQEERTRQRRTDSHPAYPARVAFLQDMLETHFKHRAAASSTPLEVPKFVTQSRKREAQMLTDGAAESRGRV